MFCFFFPSVYIGNWWKWTLLNPTHINFHNILCFFYVKHFFDLVVIRTTSPKIWLPEDKNWQLEYCLSKYLMTEKIHGVKFMQILSMPTTAAWWDINNITYHLLVAQSGNCHWDISCPIPKSSCHRQLGNC